MAVVAFRNGGSSLHLCYVDESGDLGPLPSATDQKAQPLLVVIGAIIPQDKLNDLTRGFTELKRTFYPGRHAHLDHALYSIQLEIKGNELRKNASKNVRREWRHALGFLDKFLSLIESHDVRIVGRVWVKPIGGRFDGRATYTTAVQNICEHFQHFLAEQESEGIVIADSRDHDKDRYVSHSIFTQKFKTSGDAYPRIVELPTFGRSHNHAGIQISDLLASALVWPLAIHTFCAAHIQSPHIRPNYFRIKTQFSDRIRSLQYRYCSPHHGKCVGGLWVTDLMGHLPGHRLFE